MRWILAAIFAALVLLMPADSPGQTKWFIFACLSAVFTAWKYVRPHLGISAAALFAYCVINGAWFWVWKHNRYLHLCVMDEVGKCIINPATGGAMADAYTQQAIRFFSADGIAKLLLVLPPLFFLTKQKNIGEVGAKLSAIFCLANIGMVFFTFFFSGHWCVPTNSCGGSLSNPSMNSSLIVATLPFLLSYFTGRGRWLSLMAAVAAVFLSKGSIGIGMLAAMAVLYAVRFRLWFLLLPAPIILAGGYFLWGDSLLSSGDRMEVWQFFFTTWSGNPLNYFFGTGYGTFGAISNMLQQITKFKGGVWWVWMHNDWLEILFTLGWVGLILSMATYLSSLLRYFFQRQYTEAISMFLLGLMMAMNFPLHHPISAAFAGWLVLSGLVREPKKINARGASSCHNC